jgi:hypothetical protein
VSQQEIYIFFLSFFQLEFMKQEPSPAAKAPTAVPSHVPESILHQSAVGTKVKAEGSGAVLDASDSNRELDIVVEALQRSAKVKTGSGAVSDGSDSNKELDNVVEALQHPLPLLSSLSESDSGDSTKKKPILTETRSRRKRSTLPTRAPELSSESDSESVMSREKTRPANRNKTRPKKELRSPSTSDEELQSEKQLAIKQHNSGNHSVKLKPSHSQAQSLNNVDNRRKKHGERTPKQTPSRTSKQSPSKAPKRTSGRSSEVRKLPPPSPSESEDEEAPMPRGRVTSSSSTSDGEIKDPKPRVTARPRPRQSAPSASDDDSDGGKGGSRAIRKRTAQSQSEDENPSVKPRVQRATNRETCGVREKLSLGASDEDIEEERRRRNVSSGKPKPPSPIPRSGSEERDGEWTRKDNKIQSNVKKAGRGRSKARSGGVLAQEEKKAAGPKKEKCPRGSNSRKRSKDGAVSGSKQQSGPGRPYPRRCPKSKAIKYVHPVLL